MQTLYCVELHSEIVGTKEYRKPEWVTHMEEMQAALKGMFSWTFYMWIAVWISRFIFSKFLTLTFTIPYKQHTFHVRVIVGLIFGFPMNYFSIKSLDSTQILVD